MSRIICGAYARYSHDDGDDSESCVLQVQRAHEAAEKRDWFLDPRFIFKDDGFSGREMLKRPDFTRCLEAVRRGAFRVLLTRDLDRLARGEVFAVGHVLQTFADHDARLFEYLREDFLRIDGENALMVAFRAYSNRAEALKASERIRDKLLARDEANDSWTSLAPFGFQNVRKRLSDGKIGVFLERKGTLGVIVRHPDEYPVLLLIGQLFLELQTFNAVAMELNKRKIPTPEGGPFWSARSISSILQAQVYRGKVVRGRMTSQDKGGTLKVVPAAPGSVRVYDRPELQVWPSETVAKIDALASVRASTKSRGTRERRHLSTGAVRCSHCGGGLACTRGATKRHGSYTCANASSGGCRTLGYRPEHVVDANVILACGMLLTDEVLARTKEIIREAFDAKSKADARALEEERLVRDISGSEKKLKNFTDAIGDADDAGVRAHLMAVLAHERSRLADLQEAQRQLKASPALEDPKAILASLEARVDELRHGLRRGGLAALPTVQDCLGEDWLKATRREDGKWDLEGEVDPVRVFFGDSMVAGVGKKQKAAITGNVTGVSITPITAPTASSATATTTPATAAPPAVTAPTATSTPVSTAPAVGSTVTTSTSVVTPAAPSTTAPAVSNGTTPTASGTAHA